jgi:hypothetical protein
LRERGATRDEVASVIYASKAWQDKHKPNSLQALAKEVARVFAKKSKK